MDFVKAGSADISVYFRLRDSTTGLAKTGLVYNSAGAVARYTRNRGTATTITLATLAAADSAHADGGFKEVDGTNAKGLYRLDLPDAAVAAGSRHVMVSIEFDAMIEETKEVVLTGGDLTDGVRMGLTALPNAAAEAAGGLYTRGSGAGQINQAANGQVNANTVAVAGDSVAATALQQGASGIVTGAAVSGTLSSTEMTTDLTEATDDHFIGRTLVWTSGVLKGQASDVTDYVGSTKKLVYVATQTGESPSAADKFVLV